MDKQLQQNVNKILAARKIQKNRIEQTMQGDIMETEQIEKRSKNVVDTLKSGFQEAKVGQIQQQQHNQQILDQLQQSNTNQGKMLQNILEHQRAIREKAIGLSPEEEELPVSFQDAQNEKWIQDLYKTNRDMGRNRTTMYELDIKDGKIGINGKIEVNKLFNNNILSLKVGGKTIYQLRPNELSKGLAALVLLPYKDIEENKISIKADDVIKYIKIMKLSGYNSSVAKKYTEILKQNEKQRSVSVGEVPVTGSGIFHYSNPRMLEDRLHLLSGSIKAGNTSNNIREEMRSIVDELLRIAKITPKMHMLLYKKFALINF